MALLLTGAQNFAKGLLKVTRGSLDLASGVGGVLDATAGLASSGVQQVQKVLVGGDSAPYCNSLTKRKRPCKNRAIKGKRKCCAHN